MEKYCLQKTAIQKQTVTLTPSVPHPAASRHRIIFIWTYHTVLPKTWPLRRWNNMSAVGWYTHTHIHTLQYPRRHLLGTFHYKMVSEPKGQPMLTGQAWKACLVLGSKVCLWHGRAIRGSFHLNPGPGRWWQVVCQKEIMVLGLE